MRINQDAKGNIIIRKRGFITHILPSMCVHQHPRKSNAILITHNSDFQNEQQGISISTNQRIYINDKPYNLDRDNLLRMLHGNIALNGQIPQADPVPKTKETDPNYVAYLQANTYEKLLAFVKKHQDNIGGKNIQDGKLVEEEFLCQFDTFIIKIGLRYHYQHTNPTLIKHIQMWGSTQYVTKPKKVFVYDENNTVTGYVYKETFED